MQGIQNRQYESLDLDIPLTASEEMFFFDAPLAHVVDWQEHRLVMLRREAGEMMFTPPSKRRGLVTFDCQT